MNKKLKIYPLLLFFSTGVMFCAEEHPLKQSKMEIDSQIVDVLLKNGVRSGLKNEQGYTALHLAVYDFMGSSFMIVPITIKSFIQNI